MRDYVSCQALLHSHIITPAIIHRSEPKSPSLKQWQQSRKERAVSGFLQILSDSDNPGRLWTVPSNSILKMEILAETRKSTWSSMVQAMGSVVIAGVAVWNQAITSRRVDETERRIQATEQANVELRESLRESLQREVKDLGREVKEEMQTMSKELTTLIKDMLKSAKGDDTQPVLLSIIRKPPM